MQELKEASSIEITSRKYAPKAVIVIGAATGGPAALTQVLPKFPRNLNASIIVVQHMRPGFINLLAQQLDGLSVLPIETAEPHQPLTVGTALFAPGNCNVSFEKSQNTEEFPFFIKSEDVSNSSEKMRRRINDTMISAAHLFGSHTIGVLLTGVGDDGRDGMKEIRERGGKTIAQDEVSSIVFDMPRWAIEGGVVDEVLPLWSIADRIAEIVGDN